MTSSKGGLNFKDFPFAFSIAVLIFPPIASNSIQDNSSTLAFEYFSVILFGSIMGSLLTIINPVAIGIGKFYGIILKSFVLKEYRHHNFINSVINRNFISALASPSISYETDKLVGMIYFEGVLGLALYRLTKDSVFVTFLNLTETQLSIVIGISIMAIILVSLRLISNFFGLKTISHFKQISFVTTLFLVYELENLSTEGKKFSALCNSNVGKINAAITSFRKLDHKKMNSEKFMKEFDDLSIRNIWVTQDQRSTWGSKIWKQRFWEWYIKFKEVSGRYKIDFNDVLVWFGNTGFYGGYDKILLSQLQSSVDLRDWNNVELKIFGLRNNLNGFLILQRFQN